ncbi:tripartite tricarboxylate transporter TctB family protein [Acuticoccus sediminis]|uniref:tripartite tricarboxylate transporter TctB family protein n=1 Tax=Acuticoccus sediminis TaxID=2184697 RepID=UPI001CFDE894|nr:tripartite tricarboxylate transporter TctB family protein [Acuticoccus sediminis]
MTYIKDRIAAGILLIVAVSVFVISGQLPFKSMIFPRMIVVVMGLCAVLMFLRTVSFSAGKAPAAASDPKLKEPFFRNGVNFLITFAALIVYTVAIGYLGYFVSTVILIIALSLALGFRDIKMLGASTVAFVALVYVVFILTFERPLPHGMFY